MKRKKPDGVSEDTWLRIDGVGKLDQFERQYDQLRKKGFCGKDAGLLALNRVLPLSPKQKEPDALEERGLPQANIEPLQIDETRIEKEIEIDDFLDKPPISIIAAAQWVLDSINRKGVTKDDCPSPGAWTMLHEARGDKVFRRKFFDTYLPKMMPTGAQMANKGRQRDDGRVLDAEMAALVAEYHGSEAQTADILNRNGS